MRHETGFPHGEAMRHEAGFPHGEAMRHEAAPTGFARPGMTAGPAGRPEAAHPGFVHPNAMASAGGFHPGCRQAAVFIQPPRQAVASTQTLLRRVVSILALRPPQFIQLPMRRPRYTWPQHPHPPSITNALTSYGCHHKTKSDATNTRRNKPLHPVPRINRLPMQDRFRRQLPNNRPQRIPVRRNSMVKPRQPRSLA